MKKVIAVILLLALSATATMAAAAFYLIQQKAPQQTTQVKKTVYKRRRTARQSVKGKNARMQLQLRQAQKHLAEEQKVEQAQQEIKRDTTRH